MIAIDHGDERIVPMISVTACRKCRRARGAALAGARGPQPVRRNRSGRCPHGKVDRTIWAPGFGPGSEPRPDPTTPEERRRGAV
jgi:hypothetical protein